MFCPQCGKELNDGAAFCPYCGAQMPISAQTQAGAPASAPVPPVNQNSYGAYAVPFGVPEADVKTTKTLGLVALIVGIFVPFVSFICGGIGIARRGQCFRCRTQAKYHRQQNCNCCLSDIHTSSLSLNSFRGEFYGFSVMIK